VNSLGVHVNELLSDAPTSTKYGSHKWKLPDIGRNNWYQQAKLEGGGTRCPAIGLDYQRGSSVG